MRLVDIAKRLNVTPRTVSNWIKNDDWQNEFKTGCAKVSEKVSALKDPQYMNILLVDDISRSGNTLKIAIEFINKELPRRKIKTAVMDT